MLYIDNLFNNFLKLPGNALYLQNITDYGNYRIYQLPTGLSKDIIPEAERFSEKLPVLFEGNCERLRLILSQGHIYPPIPASQEFV